MFTQWLGQLATQKESSLPSRQVPPENCGPLVVGVQVKPPWVERGSKRYLWTESDVINAVVYVEYDQGEPL